MPYAILVLSPLLLDAVAWPQHQQFGDVIADRINPSVDFGSPAFWAVSVKAQLKASGGVNSFILQSADVLAGTGNVTQISQSQTFASTLLGSCLVHGWFPRSQQYMNIDLTVGTSASWDFDVFATQVR